jgi:aminopeptidase N
MNCAVRYGLLLAVFLIGLLSYAQNPDPDFSEKVAVQESKRLMKLASFKEQESYAETDLIYQRMEWKVDPAVKYITGMVTSYFKAHSEGVSKVIFDLKDNMQVDSVIQKNARLTFTHSDDLLTIMLKNQMAQNIIDSISVFYQGQPVVSGFLSFVSSTHNTIPVIWTLSEPYGAREWWPCKQSLADKIDSMDIFVTTPDKFRTASNGLLVSEKVSNTSRTMHWKHRYPIATYLVAIAVTNYADYTDTLRISPDRMIPVLNFVYPENLAAARSQTPQVLQSMELFNWLFGEYPFSREKYGQAQFGWGGGMEHQTMTFIVCFDFELLTHELAHSWFGNCITLSSWHDIWLNEGFATYATGLAYERLFDGKCWNQWKRNTLNSIMTACDGSVYVSDTTSVSRIFSGRLSYSKGGYLLHMLRWKLGDAVFFTALQDYFNDPAVKYGFASQQQWVDHLEAASGISLGEFFNDWYYGEGYPVYSANFENNNENTLRIWLSQTTSHPSVTFFEMPVPVRVYSAGRKDSADFRLEHTVNNQLFDISVPFRVGELVIDPDLWLVRKIDKVTGVETPDRMDSGIRVIPNPSVGSWQIMTQTNEIPEKVEIYDLSGHLLVRQKPENSSFMATGLRAGIYLVRITTCGQVFETKLVKR